MASRLPSRLARPLAYAIGQVVRAHRRERKLSQEQFAELAGFHRTQIGFLERGERTPNVQTMVDAARALKMHASDLLREAGY
jgi:transcriptional regulator with XRE-family HTH domain